MPTSPKPPSNLCWLPVCSPEGRTWRVFLLDPYPTLGIGRRPLYLRRTAQSIPLGLLHETCKKQGVKASLEGHNIRVRKR